MRKDVARALDEIEPTPVVDLIGLVPEQVQMALDVFADVDAYVFISSGSVYAEPMIPFREDSSQIHDYVEEEIGDEMPTVLEDGMGPAYGPRKAECDRRCFAAAERGVNAFVVRPSFVYGPYDYLGRMDYWIERVARTDRIVVPGDGGYLFNPVFAPDLARAIRIVAERGTPGEAYNVSDRVLLTRDEMVLEIADMLETTVEIFHVGERTLAANGLDATAFPLTLPFPLLIDASKVAALGWESTSPREAIAQTVEEYLESDRTGQKVCLDSSTETELLDAVDTASTA